MAMQNNEIGIVIIYDRGAKLRHALQLLQLIFILIVIWSLSLTVIHSSKHTGHFLYFLLNIMVLYTAPNYIYGDMKQGLFQQKLWWHIGEYIKSEIATSLCSSQWQLWADGDMKQGLFQQINNLTYSNTGTHP